MVNATTHSGRMAVLRAGSTPEPRSFLDDVRSALVAALYVERGGPYFGRLDVDFWDKERDARAYAGPHPVVAHPPCGPWGRLKHLYKGAEHDCAPRAVEQVRAWGGILEHPRGSLLWPHMELPMPGDVVDRFGGFTLQVDQCAWGHVARKTTWLYFIGVDCTLATSTMREGGTPTHWISGFRSTTKKYPKHYVGRGSAVPPGIKVCSSQQRRRTPPLFADWLIGLARSSQTARAA